MIEKPMRERRAAARPSRQDKGASSRDPAVSLAKTVRAHVALYSLLRLCQGTLPAQWTTLRYLADAPEMSRTAAHIARFQQIALGPVTRTIRTLIAKGLVAKAGQGAHHRSELLALTAKGVQMLANDPLQPIISVLRSLPEGEHEKLAELLLKIIACLNTASATTEDIVLRP